MRKAKVQFMNDYGLGKEYNYLTTVKDLKKGDLVVVEAKDFYVVAVFSKYSAGHENATKFIVTKLELDNLEKQKERAEQLEEIKQAINDRIREVERQKQLDEMAAQDGKLKELITTLRELEDE